MMDSRTWGWAGTLALAAALAALLGGRAVAGPFSDRVDPVILKGSALPAAFLGAPIESIELLSSDGQNLRPIPFQVDEVDANGEYFLKGGTATGAGDGKLDGQDELVFMAFDAGVPHSGQTVEGNDAKATITITDAATNVSGQVLVLRRPGPAPRSQAAYVSFDPVSRMATTDAYRFGYSKQYAFYYDFMAAGKGPDVLDRLKVRSYLGAMGLEYMFDEEKHIDYVLVGHLAGPIRGIIRSKNKITMGPFGLIDVPQTVYMYKDVVILMNMMDTRLNPAAFGLEFRVEIGHDLTLKEDEGYRICTNTLPACQDFKDKIPPERIKELTEQTMVWGGFDGPSGALISYFTPDPRMPIKTHAIFLDDLNLDKAPEEFKGSKPLLSYHLIDWKDVKPDVYHLDFYHFFMPQYSVEEVERFARMVKDPLKATAL